VFALNWFFSDLIAFRKFTHFGSNGFKFLSIERFSMSPLLLDILLGTLSVEGAL
jgi:hypothetical protein